MDHGDRVPSGLLRTRRPRSWALGRVVAAALALHVLAPARAAGQAGEASGTVVVVPDGPAVPDVDYHGDPAAERASLVAELVRAEDLRDHVRPRLGRAIAGLFVDAGLIVGAIYLGRYVDDHACAQLESAAAMGAPVAQPTSACERGTRIGTYTLVGLGAALGAGNLIRIALHAVRRSRANDAVDHARLRLDEFDRGHPRISFDVRTDGRGAFGLLSLRF